MPANTQPIFGLTPISTNAKVTTADATTTGIGANVQLVMTAGANGAFVQKLIVQPIATSGSTTTSPATLRIYVNNGSSAGTAANNVLVRELSLSAISVSLTASSAALSYEVPLNFQLQANYTLLAGVTAMAANTQWNILTVASSY